MSTCRSCGSEVVFVPSSKTGRPMILDAESRKGVIHTYRTSGVPTIFREGIDNPEGREARVVDVYTDHHATCPNAAEWKGRRR